MKVYKLKYQDKDNAIADLLAKGVYVETTTDENETSLSYAEGVHAIVEIGLIVLTNGTYDEQGAELTAPVYADGYHYDVLTDNEITFENEVQVNNPKHTFFGM
jgi:uncharacterized membrane protein YvbJ